MPLGAYSGNVSGDFYNGRNRQMDTTVGNHSKGVGTSGGRPVKKLGVVAKAVAATMSTDRVQGVSRTQKDVKNDRVMYARNQQYKYSKEPVTGGQPITVEQAKALRLTVFGACDTPPRGEWLRTGFVFRDPEKELSYGLRARRNGTRGMQTAIQGYILKNLLFTNTNNSCIMRPSKQQQLDALCKSITEILWKIGENEKVVVCLPQEKSYVPHSLNYFQDNVTEKLHLFELTNIQDLEIFLKRYLHLFQDDPGPGSLLLLYSSVLTRGLSKIVSDLMDEKVYLISSAEEGSICIVTLMLTGRATPNLHNGIVNIGDEQHYAIPHYGILARSEVGLLVHYEETSTPVQVTQIPGSRLKTPSYPIWITCAKGHYGILFNTNRELLRNHLAERRFPLTHYSCSGSENHATVDTRSHPNEQTRMMKTTDDINNTTSLLLLVECLIHTKWEGASVQWTGVTNAVN
ncbi:inactive ubiquitin carboxyl-terminal hydrolase MINDY-4B isoform X1 [Melanaphis sacchari]|uniref:Ubiquitin carboxyl-terminal hydrolase MINDY n=1 Tax=Melanaphis sacchari TaxID=742174 RepID=A0A2H8TU45_9HEMI|nr:inactive ubiquitin carboxyl-terminal hydrolase MINDY-4B isoform X1 [Melanaphis sacchari]XP_025196339.1 inactive ubiquitin carboxyl-terminal hydrolase MINDY-4B isoform X1 [Melanaphis sacchari]